MKAVRKHKVRLLPIDGEHSAIFQCLQGSRRKEVRKLILTASGGPLWNASRAELRDTTPEGALAHPVWKMGRKISVDCATMMNKGLEVIEAHWLFGVSPANIEVVIHPQSVVHSMVEFVDGFIIAQLGWPDMSLPIQYALTYPKRVASNGRRLSLTEQGQLTFAKPDPDKFPCLKLACRAVEQGGTMPAVLSAANEEAVNAFLGRRLSFPGIAAVNEGVMDAHGAASGPTLDEMLAADRWARDEAQRLILAAGKEPSR
jgi:1-deoxy-D-xylulose-5-phosphate reductoisomerase